MQRPILFGAIQMSSQADLEANLSRAGALVAEAAGRGAKVVLLPENFAFMGEEADKRRFAEDLDDAAAKGFANGFVFGMDVELFVDAADVVADGVDADRQPVSRPLIAVPLGQ